MAKLFPEEEAYYDKIFRLNAEDGAVRSSAFQQLLLKTQLSNDALAEVSRSLRF